MPKQKISAREIAASHIEAALETGVRGDLRDALKKAADIAAGRRATAITDLEYRQLAEGAKLGDPDRPGLLMRHGKRTGKVWVFRYQHPTTKKQVELQFGRYPKLATAEAREVWRGLREQRQAGREPRLTTNDDSVPVGPTVGELVKRYVADYARVVKAQSSAREDERLLNRFILPHYSDMPASAFDHDVAKSVLSNIHRSGALREAEKVRSVLSTMFNVAAGKTRKISTLDGTWLPPDHPNPVEAVMLPKREKKTHNPTQAELRAYACNLNILGQSGDILRTQLETFARIGEAVRMRWDELDLDKATWTLPASRSKNGKAHVVMLARQTVDRLRRRQETAETDFVFPAATDASRPTDKTLVIRTLSKNRGALGVSKKFTSHATRHAALTWVAEHGGGRDIRDRLSNHTPPKDGADHIYVAAEHNDEARRFTQMWVDHLSALAAENVTSIEGRHQ